MAQMTSLRNGWLVGQRDSGKDRGSLQKGGGGARHMMREEQEMNRDRINRRKEGREKGRDIQRMRGSDERDRERKKRKEKTMLTMMK